MYATQDEVIAALNALSPDQCRWLDYQGRRLAFGTIYATGAALFSEAIERALDLRRQWSPARMTFLIFLRNTMASISDNDRSGFHAQHIANVSALTGEDGDVDDDTFLSAFGETPSNSVLEVLERAEDHAAMLRDYDALFEYFSDDEDVWNILDAMEQGLIGVAIKKHCCLDNDPYVAARKRLNRGAAKLKGQRTKS